MERLSIDEAIARTNEVLKSYKDAEEQRLLLKLPCKVGDTVWYIDDDDDDYPLELLVTKIEVEENDYLRYYTREKDNCGKIGFIEDDIGKTVFLTKEEAEQALEKIAISKMSNGFYTFSDNHFKDMKKQDLINYIRTIEKNWENQLITNDIQYANCKKLLVEERNKAIDEFAERMKEKWIESDDLSISSEFFDFVEEIAEEMRGAE